MYLTTTISIMLVLGMVGVGCVLLLSAGSLIRHVRQNVSMDVVIAPHTSPLAEAALDSLLAAAPYCQSHHYISREQALQDHIRSLGEDPTKFLGFNPLLPSYHVDLNGAYASADSLRAISDSLMVLPAVDRVVYPEQMVSLLDRYLGRVILAVSGGAFLLLLVAWALIMNMIRLQIYSNRFLINTMTLVGATSWHVRRPFVRRSIGIGALAATLASAAIALLVYLVWYRWGVWLVTPSLTHVGLVLLVLYGTGILMTLIASLLATGRYIRMQTSTLYEI